jgi:hypothetical protein
MWPRIYDILSYSKSEIYTTASINDKYLQYRNEIEIEITLKIGILHLENTMKIVKDNANKVGKDPNKFQVILLTYLHIIV